MQKDDQDIAAPHIPKPTRPPRKKLGLLVLLVGVIVGGGYAYYTYGYHSEKNMIKRAQRAMNVGSTYEAESILKDCIRQHDGAKAKAKLVELYVDTGDLQQMLLLDKTMSKGEDTEGILGLAFANGYSLLANQEFKKKQWSESSSHYYTASQKYRYSHISSHYARVQLLLQTDSTKCPEPGLSLDSMACLRNAIAASLNGGDKAQVEKLGKYFVELCEKYPEQVENTETLKRYLQEVREFRGRLN